MNTTNGNQENLPILGVSAPAQINSIEAVGQQAQLIRDLVKREMKENVDYGIIPGTKKETLYKSGAEKICLLFNLAPEFEVNIDKFDGEHREATVKCRLLHRLTGQLFGSGVGSCSTMESKYKYRSEWQDGQKVRVLNKDIADQYNTVLKMAKKRAVVDAAISSGAAGDLFTQDMEDVQANAMAGGYAENKSQPANAAVENISKAFSGSKAGDTEGHNPGSLIGNKIATGKIYAYKLPFGVKDEAKARRGRWNPEGKTWDFVVPHADWSEFLVGTGAHEASAAQQAMGDDDIPFGEQS